MSEKFTFSSTVHCVVFKLIKGFVLILAKECKSKIKLKLPEINPRNQSANIPILGICTPFFHQNHFVYLSVCEADSSPILED